MQTGTSVVSGNAAFWEQTYSDNFASLCSRARLLTGGNSADAEDIVSEAFVRAMRYAADPESIRNVVSYLWTATKRVWSAQQVRLSNTRTQYLGDMKTKDIESLPSVRVEPKIEAILENEEMLREFYLKFGPLSLAEKSLIELRIEGYSLDEIAGQLNEDVRRTRFRFYRLVARQRKRMALENAPA